MDRAQIFSDVEVPDSRVPLTPPQQVRLIPYGCTNLRMTEMPWIQAESPT